MLKYARQIILEKTKVIFFLVMEITSSPLKWRSFGFAVPTSQVLNHKRINKYESDSREKYNNPKRWMIPVLPRLLPLFYIKSEIF